jgi:phage-related protein
MTIKTIPELIDFIDEYNIQDIQQINSITEAMFSKSFFAISFTDNPKDKYYFIHHLRNVQKEIETEGTTQRHFIDFPHPFNIKDIFAYDNVLK